MLVKIPIFFKGGSYHGGIGDAKKRLLRMIGATGEAGVGIATIQVAEVPPGPPVLQTLVAEIYGLDYARQMAVALRALPVVTKLSQAGFGCAPGAVTMSRVTTWRVGVSEVYSEGASSSVMSISMALFRSASSSSAVRSLKPPQAAISSATGRGGRPAPVLRLGAGPRPRSGPRRRGFPMEGPGGHALRSSAGPAW